MLIRGETYRIESLFLDWVGEIFSFSEPPDEVQDSPVSAPATHLPLLPQISPSHIVWCECVPLALAVALLFPPMCPEVCEDMLPAFAFSRHRVRQNWTQELELGSTHLRLFLGAGDPDLRVLSYTCPVHSRNLSAFSMARSRVFSPPQYRHPADLFNETHPGLLGLFSERAG